MIHRHSIFVRRLRKCVELHTFFLWSSGFADENVGLGRRVEEVKVVKYKDEQNAADEVLFPVLSNSAIDPSYVAESLGPVENGEDVGDATFAEPIDYLDV